MELFTEPNACAERCVGCGEPIPRGAGRYRFEDRSWCLACAPAAREKIPAPELRRLLSSGL